MKYVNANNFVFIYPFYSIRMIMLHSIFLFFHSVSFHMKNNHHIMDTMVTEDSISLLLHGAANVFPLVQVFALNHVNSLNSSSIQFWISILDGLHKHELLLRVIYSHLVENGKLKQGTIIKITKCPRNIVRNITYFNFLSLFLSISFTLFMDSMFVSHSCLIYLISQDYRIDCTRGCQSGCRNY